MSKQERNSLCLCGSGKKYKNCCLNKETDKLSFSVLDENVYRKDFLEKYREIGCNPNLLIEFPFILPFYVPIVFPNTFSYKIEQFAISFRFDKLTSNEGFKYYTGNDNAILNKDVSKLSIIYGLEVEFSELSEVNEEILNVLFDIAIDELNDILMSYSTIYKDQDIHYITKEMLPSILPTRIIDINNWLKEHVILFMLHPNIPHKKIAILPNKYDEIFQKLFVLKDEKNPFIVNERLVLFAKRYLRDGYYHEAVIYIQISIETLVRTLYKELLKESGIESSKIEEMMENTPFMTIIKKHFPSHLGGNWDLNNNKEVGNWNKNVYLLRNKSVHTGYIPSFSEANSAVYDGIEFRKFIVSRLKQNMSKYPKTNQFITLPQY